MDLDKIKKLVDLGYSKQEISNELKINIGALRGFLKRNNLKTHWKGFQSVKNFTDEFLIEIANKSDSINHFLENLGVIKSGGTWYHYKKKLLRLGITFDNAKINGCKRGGKKTAQNKNQLSLQRKVRLPRPTLKKAMDLANIEYKCFECRINEWRGKKIKLHIHHKDEDKTNNSIENLEYLCPNCHGIKHYEGE